MLTASVTDENMRPDQDVFRQKPLNETAAHQRSKLQCQNQHLNLDFKIYGREGKTPAALNKGTENGGLIMSTSL